MRLFLVFEETQFFQPEFVFDLIKLLKNTDEIKGAAVITKVPDSANLSKYLKKNWSKFYFKEILLLVYYKYSRLLISSLRARLGTPPLYTIKHVLNYYDIDWFPVEYKINAKSVLKKIRDVKPDVIINSGSLIFGVELLKIPTKCVINRHSSLLPSFGGLWPVFHAVRLGGSIGVTAHIMARKIDAGLPLAQEKIDVKKLDTLFDIYKKTFNVSAKIVFKAIDKVRKNDFSSPVKKYQNSYFSWPTDEDWEQFRSKGMKWI